MTGNNQNPADFPLIYRKVRGLLGEKMLADFTKELGLEIVYSAPGEVHVRDKHGVTVFIYINHNGDPVLPRIYIPQHIAGKNQGVIEGWTSHTNERGVGVVKPDGEFISPFPDTLPIPARLAEHAVTELGNKGKIDLGYSWADTLIQMLAKESAKPSADSKTKAKNRIEEYLDDFAEETNNITAGVLIDPRVVKHVGTYIVHDAVVDVLNNGEEGKPDFWLTLWNGDFPGAELRIKVVSGKITHAYLRFCEDLPDGFSEVKESMASGSEIGIPWVLRPEAKLDPSFFDNNPEGVNIVWQELLRMGKINDWASNMIQQVTQDIGK